MIKIGLRSILIGFIITSCISLIYPLENLGLLIGINIVTIILAFIALKVDDDKRIKIEVEEKENGLKFNESILKLLENRSELNNILSELKDRKELNTIIDQLKNRIELNNILEEIKAFEALSKKGKEELLLELKNKEKEEIIINELKNRSELDNILSELKDRKELNSILEEIKAFEELGEKSKGEVLTELKNREKEEELVDLSNKMLKVLKANNGENIVDSIEELNEQVSIKFDENKNALIKYIKYIEEILEELSDITKSQLENYKDITTETATSLNNAAKENRVNVKLLQDSYKILNSLMEE